MTFNIQFVGRKAGALGICYPISALREGANEEEAISNLYDEYEHVKVISIKAVPEDLA